MVKIDLKFYFSLFFCFVVFFFFFSSRRRHTRFDCDWSSDVCSSDLVSFHDPLLRGNLLRYVDRDDQPLDPGEEEDGERAEEADVEEPEQCHRDVHRRSEERRVGKECRSRWAPYQ